MVAAKDRGRQQALVVFSLGIQQAFDIMYRAFCMQALAGSNGVLMVAMALNHAN